MKNIREDFIVITGSAGFLGSFFVEELIKKDLNLILIDSNNKLLNIQKKKLKKIYTQSKYYFFNSDISKEKNIKKIFNFSKKNKLKIVTLINLATIDAKPSVKITNKYLSTKDWNKEIAVGLTGSYLMIKYFGEQMYKNKKGRIVNIGSDLSVIAPNQDIYKKSYKNFVKPISYSVIKHGMSGMTKYFASLFADKQVTCNMLSPGPVLNKQSSDLKKNLIRSIPMKRLARQNDLIGTLLFLISEESSFITGQNIIIDGGKTII
jgi:NAD(P)-dependent dehydrogenase (short-subunit alcohol dehydrogenase family)|tara:strand:+ start:872 stop:1660 length:789 start_codon:yes stop_codon:yes gene_type:complete